MKGFLDVGIMQYTFSWDDTYGNLEKIERCVKSLMDMPRTPDIIVGFEASITGFEHQERCPGKAIEFLSRVARENAVYLIPGSFNEASDELKQGEGYNSIPIFGPDGELIDVYRKMCPWVPFEQNVPGKKYVVFDCKGVTIGVANCYDTYFPEIFRNLAFLGAEVVVRPHLETLDLKSENRMFSCVRAMENQIYHVSVGGLMTEEDSMRLGITPYGGSNIFAPDGTCIFEAENRAHITSIALNIDELRHLRRFGSHKVDPSLKHIRTFNLENIYHGRMDEAPLYKRLDEPFLDVESFKKAYKS